MIRTVVFDIGNVLADFDYLTYIHKLYTDEEVISHINNAIWGTGCWKDLDRGEDTEAVFRHMMEAEPDYQDEVRRAMDGIGECVIRMDYSIPWIQSLKERGYQVLYLSNYSYNTMKANREALDFLPYMDGGVFSCEIRSIKPEEKIYRTLFEKYSLDPGSCVFIDDMKENLEAAERLGMKTIQFRSCDQAKEDLEKLLSSES